jgi:hypothetical protein
MSDIIYPIWLYHPIHGSRSIPDAETHEFLAKQGWGESANTESPEAIKVQIEYHTGEATRLVQFLAQMEERASIPQIDPEPVPIEEPEPEEKPRKGKVKRALPIEDSE